MQATPTHSRLTVGLSGQLSGKSGSPDFNLGAGPNVSSQPYHVTQLDLEAQLLHVHGEDRVDVGVDHLALTTGACADHEQVLTQFEVNPWDVTRVHSVASWLYVLQQSNPNYIKYYRII